MKNLPPIIQSITKLISGNLAVKVIGIMVLAFYARVLTKEELSIFPIYIMLSSLASLIFSFGITPTMLRILPSLLKENIEEGRSLIVTSNLIIISGTVFVSIFVYLFSKEINYLLLDNKLHHELIQLMTLGFVAMSISNVTEQVLWASERFGRKALLSVVESFVKPCCTIPLFFAYGIKGLVVGMILNEIIKAVLALFWVRDIVFGKRTGHFSAIYLIQQSLPLYLESYLMYFRREGDNWLVGTLMGPASLAVYYIAKTIYNSFYMFYSSIDQVVTTNLAMHRGDQFCFIRKADRIHASISLLSIPGLLLIISALPAAIPLVAGPGYQAAILPAAILLLVLSAEFQRITIGRTVFLLLSPSARFYNTCVETLVLIPSLYIFGLLFGASGVAGARLLTQLAGGCFGLYMINRKMTCRPDFKLGFILMMTGAVPVVIAFHFYDMMDSFPKIVQAIVGPLAWLASFAAIFGTVAFFLNITFSSLKEALLPWKVR